MIYIYDYAKTAKSVIGAGIGARKVSQVKDNLDCLKVKLTTEQLQRLDEVSRIELGFPHDFLSSDMIHERLFGGTFDAIDNPRQINK